MSGSPAGAERPAVAEAEGAGSGTAAHGDSLYSESHVTVGTTVDAGSGVTNGSPCIIST